MGEEEKTVKTMAIEAGVAQYLSSSGQWERALVNNDRLGRKGTGRLMDHSMLPLCQNKYLCESP